MSGLRPRPEPSPASAPYWEGLRRGRLLAPRCQRCQHLFFYPRARCPRCFGAELGWEELSGRGRVYSCTVVRQPAHPAFVDDVPYVFAVVELDEGVRMPTNVVGCDPEDVTPDARVVVELDVVEDELTLPLFRLDCP